jgi:hypothetical protein
MLLPQYVVEASVFCLYPAGQVYVEHNAFAVQQLAFLFAAVVPHVTPSFAESQYLPVSHAISVIPPHFVVSAMQHEPRQEVGLLVGQVVVRSVTSFNPAEPPHVAERALPTVSARAMANISFPAIFMV